MQPIDNVEDFIFLGQDWKSSGYRYKWPQYIMILISDLSRAVLFFLAWDDPTIYWSMCICLWQRQFSVDLITCFWNVQETWNKLDLGVVVAALPTKTTSHKMSG